MEAKNPSIPASINIIDKTCTFLIPIARMVPMSLILSKTEIKTVLIMPVETTISTIKTIISSKMLANENIITAPTSCSLPLYFFTLHQSGKAPPTDSGDTKTGGGQGRKWNILAFNSTSES